MRRAAFQDTARATAAVIVIAMQAMAVQAADDVGLRFVVRTDKRTYRPGEVVTVQYEWTNTTDHAMTIPAGPSPGSVVGGDPKSPTARRHPFAVYYEGAELPFQGVTACVVSVSGPRLSPGETRSTTWDINDYYQLERPGLYVIRAVFAGFVGDKVPPDGWRGLIEHPDVEFVIEAQK